MSSAQVAPGTAIETFTVSGVSRGRTGATTYDATDAQGQAVQVTVYAAECFPSALVLERSLRELRQLQTLANGRIARVLGCGKLGGGTWEAHAVLPSTSLAEHLAGGALAEADALALAAQIGDALSEAQKVGVIHRNLGADTVFPSPAGVVVTGFAVGAPQGGRSFGPLDTMAPEQVEGKVVDQRTLIYNLAALVHHMLRGAPLFSGDAATMLAAHLSTDPGIDVAPALRRGLAKDPRVRPMMLRQFVTEIAGGVGTSPAAGGPTSRGWTMFTTEAAPTPAAATPAAATPAAATPAAAPAPAAPAAQGEGAKPSTRGWTMFMQAQPDDGAPGSTPAPTPAPTPGSATPIGTPVVAAPTPATPAAAAPAAPAPAAPAAGAKPSTRGWTMFMQAQDDAAPAASTPAAAPATPAAAPVTPAASGTPVAAPMPAAVPTPVAASGSGPTPVAGAGPSSRGWTMFTTADDAAPAPAGPSTGTPTVPLPAAPAPAAAASPAPAPAPATPAAGAEPAKPSTRGWTMFTRDDETPVPATLPVAASAPSTATPTDPLADPNAAPPSSRGWTMFMEPGAAAAAAASAGVAPAPDAPPPAAPTPVAASSSGPIATSSSGPIATPSSTPTPAATPAVEGEAPGGQRRGWTMFMEAPIASAGAASFGPATASETPTPAPEPETASSDNRGWTVFGTPSPVAAEAAAAAAPASSPAAAPIPAAPPVGDAGRTVISTPQPQPQPVAHDASEGPTASGQVTADAAPDPAPGRGRTVVATGVPAVPGSVGGVTGRTVFPSASPPMPDTQYFRRGDIPPERTADRPAARTTAVDVPVPAGRGPAEERESGPRSSMPVPTESNLPERSGGSRTAMMVVIGLVVVAAIVGIVATFT